MSKYAILFPGQGSQKVGMGADLFSARRDLLVEIADRVLGWSLETLVSEGPQEELTRTEHAQPALFAVSYALWIALRDAVPNPPAAAAGHSLGEYTALAAAGVFSYEEGLALVSERGRAMADAPSESDPSGMAALIGTDLDHAERVAADRRAEGGRLWVANVNTPSQIVVAGSASDIEWLSDNARSLDIRRAIPLDVAGAFHSPYMRPAADRLATALERTDFAAPEFPVYANTTGLPVEDPARQLGEQLVEPVLFAATLEQMAADGITTFVHVGPGDVTGGLVKRTLPDAVLHVVSDLDGIATVVSDPSVH
jgi:[acyl-carrier-protein] S-malonyltransferase